MRNTIIQTEPLPTKTLQPTGWGRQMQQIVLINVWMWYIGIGQEENIIYNAGCNLSQRIEAFIPRRDYSYLLENLFLEFFGCIPSPYPGRSIRKKGDQEVMKNRNVGLPSSISRTKNCFMKWYRDLEEMKRKRVTWGLWDLRGYRLLWVEQCHPKSTGWSPNPLYLRM